MGLTSAEILFRSAEQAGDFVPRCSAEQAPEQERRNCLKTHVFRWNMHRNNAQFCSAVPPFPFLEGKGAGTRAGTNTVGGRLGY